MKTAEHPGSNEPVEEAEECAYLEQRDKVSDEVLVARMLAAPVCGGEILVELSEFVSGRRTDGALLIRDEPPKELGA